ncbi:PREDICTED: WAP four-disulfide core domain protein 2 isoform X2 [Galeopterus variegatus]|uniref:WAP four-disulfide core domain protein 2 n=1 Tax=Galeopterus variegatus TaxID=482537 RepID=A0ABM0RU24_GALVR|nr:PREDICTED: WAP four-disulfide core domain protein 2 isoform X1 [Galeopterus variegatus]XP_008584115.1 PREDICTED: WAP four-disulfide core domain protein 2 isoform X2 [Galeopterus variegatus]
MPVCRLGPLAAALLGLLLLGLRPVTGAEKAGVCPQLQETVKCTQECASDSECAGNLKCCRAACSSVCSAPNEKQGSCPPIRANFPQLGLCYDQCQVDSQCSGQMKCCRNGCGRMSCLTPKF